MSSESGVMSKCIDVLDENMKLENLPDRSEPGAILMCDPAHFKVVDVKNPFMQGNVNKTDQEKAIKQWQGLKDTFEKAGSPVKVIAAERELEDMVFTANQVLLGENRRGARYVVLANMVHESRKKEVPHFGKWFFENKYEVLQIDPEIAFEGQGDAIWQPGKQLLWGGWGHRTDKRAYDQIAKLLNVNVVRLHLVNPTFYHLDTCFCPLDGNTVMFYPGAFEQAGVKLIKHFFANAIEVGEKDASNFACNAVVIGRNVILQKGSPDTCQKLKESGFEPQEVDTSEFMKSGGSACCLKMFVY